jgi:hypothetical protein
MSYSLRMVMVGCVVTASASACLDASDELTSGPRDDEGATLVAPAGVPTGVVATKDLAGDVSLAAGPCSRRSDGRYNCVNRVPSPIYGPGTTTVIDHLWSNPSWFVCRTEGGFSGGGTHQNRWEWTQGDENGAWGWVRDIDIASETDPMAQCVVSEPMRPVPVPTPRPVR